MSGLPRHKRRARNLARVIALPFRPHPHCSFPCHVSHNHVIGLIEVFTIQRELEQPACGLGLGCSLEPPISLTA